MPDYTEMSAEEELTPSLKIAIASDLHAYGELGSRSEMPSYLCASKPSIGNQDPVGGLLHLIKNEQLVADILVSPGDLTDRADPAGLLHGWSAIHDIGLELKASLVTAVTGNHDLDTRYKTHEFDPKEALQNLSPPYPLPTKTDNNQYWAQHYTIVEKPSYRLVLLNSCAHHSRQEELDHGRLSELTLSTLESDLQSRPRKAINILVCHHHPHQHSEIRLGDYDVMKNGQLLLELLPKYGNWLVVHGHKHHPKVSYAAGSSASPVVFAAGSLSAVLYPELQTRTRNQFYIVEFAPSATGRVSGVLCVRHTMSSNRRQYAQASQEDAEGQRCRASGRVAQDIARVA